MPVPILVGAIAAGLYFGIYALSWAKARRGYETHGGRVVLWSVARLATVIVFLGLISQYFRGQQRGIGLGFSVAFVALFIISQVIMWRSFAPVSEGER